MRRREFRGIRLLREGVSDIRELLAGKHSNPAIVRQELARHIDAIALLSGRKGDTVSYKDKWKPPGEVLGHTDGAGGAVRSLPPELPPGITMPFEGVIGRAA